MAKPNHTQPVETPGPAGRLGRSFYRRRSTAVARALIGCTLVRRYRGKRIAGRIVEVEAYLGPDDKAAHSYRGRRTPRNEAMYADAGHAYVYFTYGMHHCVNVVTGKVDVPTAVLIRALEPAEGLGAMRRHRAAKIDASKLRDRDLCSGPAKLTQALAIDLSHNGVDLVDDSPLWIEPGDKLGGEKIVTGPRIGIGYAEDWIDRPLRYWIDGNEHVSRR